MQLKNSFMLAVPVEEAWAVLNSPEIVAPCFPGATLTEYTSDSFVGTVKMKLGPVTMLYQGRGAYVERDEAVRTVVIEASGKDSRGGGTAAAKVTGSLQAAGADKTEVNLVTDLTITGKAAQFGRGVITDVSEKILRAFTSCLAEKLSGSGTGFEG